VVLLALAALTFVLGAWTFDPKLSLSGDNTEFMTLARSLVQGQGLSYINQPNPQPATKYPFGFPLMLAPLEWLFPGNWAAIKWMVLVLFCLAVPVFYLLARDQFGPVPALAAALLCLTNPLLVDYAHQEMSEVPYLLFSLVALLLVERAAQQEGVTGNRWLWAGFAFLMWAYYVRSVGLVLIVAVVVYLLLRHRKRQALSVAGAAFLAALPWALRNRAVGGGGDYFRQLVLVNPYFPEQGTLDLAGLVDRVVRNLQANLAQILPRVFWPAWEPAGALLNPVSVVLICLALYAAVLVARRRQHLLLFGYAVVYLGTVLVWPWMGDRFLLPGLPIVIFFGVQVAVDLLHRLEGRGAYPAAVLVAAVAFVALLVANAMGLHRLAASGQGDYPPPWRNYYAAGQWLKSNAPADAVICCRKDSWLYIVTGRSCVVYPFKEPDQLVQYMDENGVDFVVVEQLGFSSTPRFLVPAIQKHPERFELLWRQTNPDTFVLRFLAAGQ
jgi:4-amino-4-deoxy-L-arabinose transferase-like glycosyltransferase